MKILFNSIYYFNCERNMAIKAIAITNSVPPVYETPQPRSTISKLEHKVILCGAAKLKFSSTTLGSTKYFLNSWNVLKKGNEKKIKQIFSREEKIIKLHAGGQGKESIREKKIKVALLIIILLRSTLSRENLKKKLLEGGRKRGFVIFQYR